MNRNPRESSYGLDRHGIRHTGKVFWNLTTAHLYEEAARRKEGLVGRHGEMVVETGKHTGRSPKDKFVVREPNTEHLLWWGKVNVPYAPEDFERMHQKVCAYLQHSEVFVQDLYVNADPAYRRRVRFINEQAWHNLFVRSLFLKPEQTELADFEPDLTVIHVPNMYAEPELDHTRSETFILCNFHQKLILIGGTGYAGEQKKSIFTAMNYELPLLGVLSMHCSCNYGPAGDCALFFGLSGTGKTTLSADPERTLIGDDEHGWSDTGVFNLEGGCYAKVIRLSQEAEPQIWDATHHFGTVLENVVIDPNTRELDLDDESLTENTRSAYPLTSVPNVDLTGLADHPKNIVFLTCDAYGVTPPISRLTPEQAMYHFLSGYTARVAGTEKGVTEPTATFSACFGDPFLALPPSVYAKLLGEKIARHQVNCWLINTGWSSGPAGETERIKIAHTRRMVKAALSGELSDGQWRRDPLFGVEVPVHLEGVPDGVLEPRSSWADPAAYDAQAAKVAGLFRDNFKQYEAEVSAAVKAGGPSLG